MATRAAKTAAIIPGRSKEPEASAAPVSKSKRSTQSRTFRATLEPDHTSLKWVIVRVPFNIAEAWTEMRRLRVRGEINGSPFRTSLFPAAGGQPGHIVLVNKRMQAAAGVRVGMEAEFVLEPDLEERSAELPRELIAAFEGDKTLLRFAQSLSESTRREIGKWIAGVKGRSRPPAPMRTDGRAPDARPWRVTRDPARPRDAFRQRAARPAQAGRP